MRENVTERQAIAPSAARLCWAHPQLVRYARCRLRPGEVSDQSKYLHNHGLQEPPTRSQPKILHHFRGALQL